jgi:hypothetical protein
MIGVTWLVTDPYIASARLRGHIPRQILEQHKLIRGGHDLVIASKHGWNVLKVREAFPKMIMDVCDDHFVGPMETHYKLTCNSKAMKNVIKFHTGIDAVVIDDPYEDPELEPQDGEGVLWFGHDSNLPDLESIFGFIRYPVEICSNDNYSPSALDAYLKACRCTIIPTGWKQAKSANRAIRSIRYGKFPVCGPLPAHEELGLGLDDFFESLDRVMSEDMRERILQLQDVVRDRFHPQKIAKDWFRVMTEAM